ncbi:hypothetical protein E4U54_001538 [Claviceps lovelessii]|nr:hypothetical protein E4U54_001538 [Claviceps lovelessii]
MQIMSAPVKCHELKFETGALRLRLPTERELPQRASNRKEEHMGTLVKNSYLKTHFCTPHLTSFKERREGKKKDEREPNMRSVSLLIAAAAAASAAAVEKRLNFKMWCTDPENTRGFCEDQGLTARCCTPTQWGLFMYEEQIALAVNKVKCEHGNGHLYCTLG